MATQTGIRDSRIIPTPNGHVYICQSLWITIGMTVIATFSDQAFAKLDMNSAVILTGNASQTYISCLQYYVLYIFIIL